MKKTLKKNNSQILIRKIPPEMNIAALKARRCLHELYEISEKYDTLKKKYELLQENKNIQDIVNNNKSDKKSNLKFKKLKQIDIDLWKYLRNQNISSFANEEVMRAENVLKSSIKVKKFYINKKSNLLSPLKKINLKSKSINNKDLNDSSLATMVSIKEKNNKNDEEITKKTEKDFDKENLNKNSDKQIKNINLNKYENKNDENENKNDKLIFKLTPNNSMILKNQFNNSSTKELRTTLPQINNNIVISLKEKNKANNKNDFFLDNRPILQKNDFIKEFNKNISRDLNKKRGSVILQNNIFKFLNSQELINKISQKEESVKIDDFGAENNNNNKRLKKLRTIKENKKMLFNEKKILNRYFVSPTEKLKDIFHLGTNKNQQNSPFFYISQYQV